MWIDDQILQRCTEPLAAEAWVPQGPMVVVGSSNEPERECYLAHCAEDGVEILRRYGGGGAVVLHPGCLVVSLGAWVKDRYRNDHYFRLLNGAVISLLGSFEPAWKAIEQAGISDLVLSGHKVAGTSQFRSRNYLIYQASILVEARVDLIERYLRHPSKEPAYRAGKSHRQFLASIADTTTAGLCTPELLHFARGHLAGHVAASLADELIPPQQDQIPTLQARRERAG